MRPRFGASPYTVTMNMDRFKKLSKADQELILDLGHKLEGGVATAFDVETEKEIATLKTKGVQETSLPEAQGKEMLAGFAKGVWNLAADANKKTSARVMELYEMAKKNGDAPATLD